MVGTSYEQFRSSLDNEVARRNLGLAMPTATARWLLADDAAARAVYAHWVAVGAPPQDDFPLAPAPTGPEGPASLPRPPGEPKKARSWARWAIPAGAGVLGLIIGVVAGGGAPDPTTSKEYQALESQVEDLEGQVVGLEDDLTAAEDAADAAGREAEAEYEKLVAGLEDREAAVVAQEAVVAEREAAVAGVEQQIAATSIGEGMWTVGVDVEPGTYRTAEAVTDCYWAIYTSGTNGDDIQANDNVDGGFPTVTLSVGQDFKNSRCGTFVKQ